MDAVYSFKISSLEVGDREVGRLSVQPALVPSKPCFPRSYTPRKHASIAGLMPATYGGSSVGLRSWSFWSHSPDRPVGLNLAAHKQSLELKKFRTDIKTPVPEILTQMT